MIKLEYPYGHLKQNEENSKLSVFVPKVGKTQKLKQYEHFYVLAQLQTISQ